ncbi:DUF29 family protein [Myxosarcina sp. GI1(2024)]
MLCHFLTLDNNRARLLLPKCLSSKTLQLKPSGISKRSSQLDKYREKKTRSEQKSILEESPSLNNYLEQNYLDWYAKSVKAMKREFSIPTDNLVDIETIMTDEYFG